LRGLDLNQRPPGYEPERSTLSLVDLSTLSPRTCHFSPTEPLILNPFCTHVFSTAAEQGQEVAAVLRKSIAQAKSKKRQPGDA
jgi:hypothetical protein